MDGGTACIRGCSRPRVPARPHRGAARGAAVSLGRCLSFETKKGKKKKRKRWGIGNVLPPGGCAAVLIVMTDVAVKFRLSFQIQAKPKGRGHSPVGRAALNSSRSCQRIFLIAF